MEIASVGGLSPSSPVGGDHGAALSGVVTELPGFKAVAPVADELPGAKPDRSGRSDTWSERRVVIDPGTQAMVTQTIDGATQNVVVQTPDRAKLGMRAYIDDVTRRHEESARIASGETPRLPALML